VPTDAPALSGSVNEELTTRPALCAARSPSQFCMDMMSKPWKAIVVATWVGLVQGVLVGF
jgi:ElaB/YqjD/DUF883 family membrane-anchored ribosome-binding protein